jgi:hypothetical protein
MKLYTEEEVHKAIDLSRDTHQEGRGYMERDEYDYSRDEVFDLLTPIELPSDEEDKEKYKYTEEDIRSAIIFGYNKRTFDLDKIGVLDENSFIQSLSQPKKKNNNEQQ